MPKVNVHEAPDQINQEVKADLREWDILDEDPDEIGLDQCDDWGEPIRALQPGKVPVLRIKPGWTIRHRGVLREVIYAFRVNDSGSAAWWVCLCPIDGLDEEPDASGLTRLITARFFTQADVRSYFYELRQRYGGSGMEHVSVAALLREGVEIVSNGTLLRSRRRAISAM